MPFSSHYVKDSCPQCDLSLLFRLHHLPEVLSVRFLPCEVTLLSPPPHCPLWKGVTTCSPHLRSGGLCCPSFGGNSYTIDLEFFHMGGLSHLLRVSSYSSFIGTDLLLFVDIVVSVHVLTFWHYKVFHAPLRYFLPRS